MIAIVFVSFIELRIIGTIIYIVFSSLIHHPFLALDDIFVMLFNLAPFDNHASIYVVIGYC